MKYSLKFKKSRINSIRRAVTFSEVLIWLKKYCDQYSENYYNKIIFIDETSMDNNFIYAAMMKKGLLLFKMKREHYGGKYFLKFINKLLDKLQIKQMFNMLIIIDNASIHKKQGADDTKQTIEKIVTDKGKLYFMISFLVFTTH